MNLASKYISWEKEKKRWDGLQSQHIVIPGSKYIFAEGKTTY